MELLFIDESESSRERYPCFVLLGVIVDSKNLVPLEKQIHQIKRAHDIENLKELRRGTRFNADERFGISKELYESIKNLDIRLQSSILGPCSTLAGPDYGMGLKFIIERFNYHLRHDKIGAIILDSNSLAKARTIRKEAYEFIIGRKMGGVYAPVFFCEDEFSNIIQLADLCAAGLRNACIRMLNDLEHSAQLKGREDELFGYDRYLPLYWDYFRRKVGSGVSGAGIKYWN